MADKIQETDGKVKREKIQRANLRKTLSRLKTQVAEKEELWLEMFTNLVPITNREDKPVDEMSIRYASQMADVMLKEYENRWGILKDTSKV